MARDSPGEYNAELVTGALAFDNFAEATAPPGYPAAGKGGSFDYNFPQQLFAYMQAHTLPQGEKYFDILSFNFYFVYGAYWEKQAADKHQCESEYAK